MRIWSQEAFLSGTDLQVKSIVGQIRIKSICSQVLSL